MTGHRESAILAAIAIILISIPAASQNVKINDGENKSGVIDSKFSDKFKTEFKPGKVVNKVLDKEGKLEVNKSFNRDVKELQTAAGYVKIVRTNNSIDKTVQTPYGRFEFGVENGDNYSRFEGGAKEEAKDIKEELLNRLEDRSEEVEEKHRIIVQEMLPDISVSVNDDPSVEHVNITNNEDEEVDLSGWKALSSNGDSTNYINFTGKIEPDKTVTYYAGSDEAPEALKKNLVEADTNIYSDGVLEVYNSAEREISRLDY